MIKLIKDRIKGFTLTEFILLIICIGIVVFSSLCLTGFIKIKKEEIKFQEYEEYLIIKAKEYTKKHEKDLFYDINGGCSYISYSDLLSVGLREKISNSVSCNSIHTFVRVVKVGCKYNYKAYLGCFDKKSLEKVYISPESEIYHNYNHEICGGVDVSNNIRFSTSLKPGINYSLDNNLLKVKISNLEGINKKIKIAYQWSLNKEKFLLDDWKYLNFNNLSYQEQMRLLDKGKEIFINSNLIKIPNVVDEDLYLVLKVEEIRDLNNRLWVNRDDGSSYKLIGPFRFRK